jgi:hypothetical protein
MSNSRRRKPRVKPQAAPGLAVPVAVAVPMNLGTPLAAAAPAATAAFGGAAAQAKGKWAIAGKVITAILAVITVVGIFEFDPRVTIEPSGPADPANPFSGYFKVTNNQVYALENVHITASVWCAAIGRSASNIDDMDKCERSMNLSSKEWQGHALQTDESAEITLGKVAIVTPPSALLYAEISIRVSANPWFWPFPFDREYRFAMRRQSNGDISWLHKPMA